jgi:hypothetical protein
MAQQKRSFWGEDTCLHIQNPDYKAHAAYAMSIEDCKKCEVGECKFKLDENYDSNKFTSSK